MAENNLKKTLLFSSLEKKELVDNIVSDESNSIGNLNQKDDVLPS